MRPYVIVTSIIVLIAALIEAALLSRVEERKTRFQRGVANAILLTILTFVAGWIGWYFNDTLWVVILVEIVMILAMTIPVGMAMAAEGAATLPEHLWLLVIVYVFTYVARKQAGYATPMTTVFWGSVLRTLPWLAFIVAIGCLCHNFFLTKEAPADDEEPEEEEPEEEEEEPEEEEEKPEEEEEEIEEEDEYDEGGE